MFGVIDLRIFVTHGRTIGHAIYHDGTKSKISALVGNLMPQIMANIVAEPFFLHAIYFNTLYQYPNFSNSFNYDLDPP